MQMQSMDSIPILCINVNITIDTMLKSDANVIIDAQCEQTLKEYRASQPLRDAVPITQWDTVVLTHPLA